MSSPATPAPPSPPDAAPEAATHDAGAPDAGAPDAGAPDAGTDVAAFYQRADALCRCAVECCRQHERAAHLGKIDALPAERRAAQTLVTLCDDALAELVQAYERAAARARPSRDDACWHAANGLWLASREFARRTRTSARAGRNMGDQGERARFTELALDYDLEASALLLLKQATEAYRRARPAML